MPAPKNPPLSKKPPSRGGKRAGAGRKRDALPPDVLERFGEPPVDSPLLVVRWWSNVLAYIGWMRMRGEITSLMAADLRGLAATQSKMVPADIYAAIDEALKQIDALKKPGATGPTKEANRGERQGLRGVPG